jgi:hypothetical protein
MIAARYSAQAQAGLMRRLTARAAILGAARAQVLARALRQAGHPWRTAGVLWPGFGRDNR